MTTRRTIITTRTGTSADADSAESGGDASAMIMLGTLGLGLGILAVDHHYSPRGQSAWSKLSRQFKALAPRGVFTGAAGAGAVADEMTKVPTFVAQVVARALSSETDKAVLTKLAKNLSGAGYPVTSAKVLARATALQLGG